MENALFDFTKRKQRALEKARSIIMGCNIVEVDFLDTMEAKLDECIKLEKERDTYEEDYNKMMEERDTLDKQIDELSKEVEELKEEINSLEEKIRDLE